MSKDKNKKKVLFICTHNNARSQMAEGLLRSLYGDIYDTYSAGIEPSVVRKEAIKVMKEIGIDISKQRSKSVDEFLGIGFDYVVTVCDYAKDTCPFFPGGKNYCIRDSMILLNIKALRVRDYLSLEMKGMG